MVCSKLTPIIEWYQLTSQTVSLTGLWNSPSSRTGQGGASSSVPAAADRSAALAVFEAEAVAIHLEDVNVVSNAIEQRTG
jgi:hypothetical protein